MSLLLLQLSLYAVTIIPRTSSQSTYDVNQQCNDVSSCGGSEQAEHVLRQLVTVNSQLVNAVSQLQRDVAELRNAISPNESVKGELSDRCLLYTSDAADE